MLPLQPYTYTSIPEQLYLVTHTSPASNKPRGQLQSKTHSFVHTLTLEYEQVSGQADPQPNVLFIGQIGGLGVGVAFAGVGTATTGSTR